MHGDGLSCVAVIPDGDSTPEMIFGGIELVTYNHWAYYKEISDLQTRFYVCKCRTDVEISKTKPRHEKIVQFLDVFYASRGKGFLKLRSRGNRFCYFRRKESRWNLQNCRWDPSLKEKRGPKCCLPIDISFDAQSFGTVHSCFCSAQHYHDWKAGAFIALLA